MFFVSGGTDCNLSVWNLHSGVRKHQIPLPDPKLDNLAIKQSLSRRMSLRSQRPNAPKPAASRIRKTIVGLLFHPFYQNTVFVMQDGGEIHVADA